MNNNRQLPICIPTITSYHFIAFPLCIIQATTNYKKEWIYNKYINFKRDNDDFNLYTYDPKFMDEDIIELENISLYQMSLRSDKELLKNKIVESIDEGKYIHGSINEFYIPVKSNYRKGDGWDNFLLYGYEDGGNVLLSIGYTKDGTFRKFKIDYDDFYQSALSFPAEEFTLDIWKLNENYDYNFDIKEVYTGLSDYLNSQDSRCILRENNMVFGSECNNKYVEYLNDIASNHQSLDLQFCSNFVEHKRLMKDRIEYISNVVLNEGAEVIAEYSEILNAAEKHYELCCKYHETNDEECLFGAAKIIKSAFEQEKGVLYKIRTLMQLNLGGNKFADKSCMLNIEASPLIKTYQNIGFPCSLLQAKYNDINNWLVNHFINIECSDCINFCHIPSPLYEDSTAQYALKNIYLTDIVNDPKRVIEKLCSWIDEGWILTGTFDEYYIPNKIDYKRNHFLHDYMIYGYSCKESIFNMLGYTKKRIYEAYTVSFSEYITSLMGVKCEKQTVALHKIKDNLTMEIDFDALKRDLKDYLYSTNHRIYYPRPDTVYGLNAQKKFIPYLEEITPRTHKIDLRWTKLFYEHKKLMHLRFSHLKNHAFVSKSNLIGIYDKCEQMMSLSHNLALKYNLSKEKEILDRIIDYVKESTCEEEEALAKAILLI